MLCSTSGIGLRAGARIVLIALAVIVLHAVGAAPARAGDFDVSSPGSDALFPDVAASAEQRAAIWLQRDGYLREEIRVRVAAHGTWGRAVRLDRRSAFLGVPKVAVNARGDAAAVWTRGGQTKEIVMAAKPAGGAWSRPVAFGGSATAHLTPGGTPRAAAVAVTPKGRAVVVWSGGSVNSKVYATHHEAAGGSWSAPTPASASAATNVALATDAAGTVILSWEPVYSPALVGVARLADGAPNWSPEQLLLAPTSNLIVTDAVAATSGVGVHAVGWIESTPEGLRSRSTLHVATSTPAAPDLAQRAAPAAVTCRAQPRHRHRPGRGGDRRVA